MVSSHRKLCALVLDEEVVQFGLLGKLITEAYAVVIDSEAQHNLALLCLLLKYGSILVVVVADVTRLAPDGFPRLVKG